MAKGTGKFKRDLDLYNMGLRICSECGETKSIDEFHKRNNAVGVPLKSKCKSCRNAYTAAWATRLDSKERKKFNGAKYREQNKDSLKQYFAAYYADPANKNKIKRWRENWMSKNAERYAAICAEWFRNNKARVYHKRAKRRAIEQNAEPRWLSVSQTRQIWECYEIAADRTQRTGIEHHVDHIVPLNNKLVCGLHVPWNLQVLTSKENLRKHNKLLEAA